MRISIHFYSYVKELTGCAETSEIVPEGATLGTVQDQLASRFPKLAPMRRSTLIAVGVEYQPLTYVLQDGDEVSLFPPVQGG